MAFAIRIALSHVPFVSKPCTMSWCAVITGSVQCAHLCLWSATVLIPPHSGNFVTRTHTRAHTHTCQAEAAGAPAPAGQRDRTGVAGPARAAKSDVPASGPEPAAPRGARGPPGQPHVPRPVIQQTAGAAGGLVPGH